MLLGLVIHSANVYMLKIWRVHDAAGSVAYDWIDGLIHSFRMEAFFWVAGYFAAIGLARMNATGYLLQGGHRLLLPAVATLFTFNLIEISVPAWWPTPGARPLGVEPMSEWIGHLWFIVDLCWLCVFAAICFRPQGKGSRALAGALKNINTPLALIAVMALLTTLPAVAPAWMARLGVGLPLLGIEGLRLPGIFEPVRLVCYAPYFILGMAVQRLGHVAQLFESIHWGWFLPSVVFSAWLWIYGSEDASWTATLLAHGLLTVVAVGAVILSAGFYAVLLRSAGLHRIFTGRALKNLGSSLPPIMNGRAAGVSRTDLRTTSSPTSV